MIYTTNLSNRYLKTKKNYNFTIRKRDKLTIYKVIIMTIYLINDLNNFWTNCDQQK